MLLEANNLHLDVQVSGEWTPVVTGVQLELAEGETVGLVGESGSGKTLTGLSLLRLLPSGVRVTGGEILLDGRDVLQLSDREIRSLRGHEMSMVFQEPLRSLNPVQRIGTQLREALNTHVRLSKSEGTERSIELLDLVGINDPDRVVRDFPHQLSGGMRQRVLIAIAIACSPKLLVADEPTTALDATVQIRILELLKDLQTRLGMALLIISHDLSVIAHMCDRVYVMYAGEIVEQGEVKSIYTRPAHPYTRALLDSVDIGEPHHELKWIPGEVPRVGTYPAGCRFFGRCDFAVESACDSGPIDFQEREDGGIVRCVRAHELDLIGAK